MFGKAKKDWLSHLLELPNGIPSHDTFGRIFARLDPVQFEACFHARMVSTRWSALSRWAPGDQRP